eukprot:6181945-Pleurochrysis_carterae.AAC.4
MAAVAAAVARAHTRIAGGVQASLVSKSSVAIIPRATIALTPHAKPIVPQPMYANAKLTQTRGLADAAPPEELDLDVYRGPAVVPRDGPMLEMGVRYEAGVPSPMESIQSVAPIAVSGSVAKCDGGGGALGHPVEFIKLEPR